MKYMEWNDAIAAHLFRPGEAGERVFLYVTEATLISLAPEARLAVDDFLQAIRNGPEWTTPAGVCRKALQTAANWRTRSLPYPPYIAYLALFVLAAGLEGDFAPHAYYPRLRTLLGEEHHGGQYPAFDRMLELWDDLEIWSMQDKVGELGIFKADFSGGWIHVGVPIAQALLTEEERRRLPEVFALASLDPTSLTTDAQLSAALIRYGQDLLRPKVLRGLLSSSNSSDDPFRQALFEVVRDELAAWDGFAPSASVDSPKTALGSLRLACRLDRIAKRARFSLRARAANPLPPDGLTLVDLSSGIVLRCKELASGWSTELAPIDEGTPFDASGVRWEEGFELKAPNGHWRLKLQARPVRILVHGSPYGLPGLIEESALQPGRPFFLLAHPDHSAVISAWGYSSCKNFTEVRLSHELRGWGLYGAEDVYDDAAVRDLYPGLALPSTVRLTLDGGIHSLRGNTYFSFAPPRVAIEGARELGGLTLFANQAVLTPERESLVFALPPDLESGNRWILSLRRNGEELARKSLYILDNINWPTRHRQQFFNRQELPIHDGFSEPAYSGLEVRNSVAGETFLSPFIKLAPQETAYLVGRRPGEVARWMHEPVPHKWQPVWIVVKRGRQRRRVEFCGYGLENNPIDSPVGPRYRIQLWKKLLWHGRRRSVLAISREHRGLWNRYQQAARDE